MFALLLSPINLLLSSIRHASFKRHAYSYTPLAQEFSPDAFGKLIDVLRLRTIYHMHDATVSVRDSDEDDFNHMLSYLYPGCENLITTIISSLNKAGGDAKDKMYLLGHSDSDY